MDGSEQESKESFIGHSVAAIIKGGVWLGISVRFEEISGGHTFLQYGCLVLIAVKFVGDRLKFNDEQRND